MSTVYICLERASTVDRSLVRFLMRAPIVTAVCQPDVLAGAIAAPTAVTLRSATMTFGDVTDCFVSDDYAERV